MNFLAKIQKSPLYHIVVISDAFSRLNKQSDPRRIADRTGHRSGKFRKHWARTLGALAATGFLCAARAGDFTVETDFPGGNAVIGSIEGDVVKIAPDNRENKTPWFYWYFAVRGAAGRTLQFVMNPQHIGVHGPGVSTDGGLTWKWLGAEAVKDGTFFYTFPAGADDVRFSVGMPYVASHFQKFLESIQGRPDVKLETLTKTPKDRPVTLLKIETPGRKGRYAVAVTCRHHASEMMGSYVGEGIIQGVLADDERGRWLRENADFFFVPFMDTDGVEDGDQGKNRLPHDHNRDYAEAPIYQEVAAIKEQLPVWSAGRPLIFIDIHDPALKGDVHEAIQLLAPQEPAQAERLFRLAEILDRDQQGPMLFHKEMIMRFGTGYNGIKEVPPPISAGWARTLPNCLLGFTLELPYANSSGFEVNAESAREFGHDIAWAVKGLLEEESAKGAN